MVWRQLPKLVPAGSIPVSRSSNYPPLKVGALRNPKGQDYRHGAKAPILTRLPHTSKPSFYFFRFDFSHCSNGS